MPFSLWYVHCRLVLFSARGSSSLSPQYYVPRIRGESRVGGQEGRQRGVIEDPGIDPSMPRLVALVASHLMSVL